VLRTLAGRLVGGVVLVLLLTLMAYVVYAVIPLNATGFSTPPEWTPERAAAARERLGLDDPVLDQWGRFVRNLGTEGSLGTTLSLYREGDPVRAVLERALPATLSLALGGFAITLLLAFPLGVLSAIRRRTLLDRGILFFTVVGIVLHPFVVGLLLKGLLAERWNIAPDGSYCPLRGETQLFSSQGVTGTCGGLVDWASHLWLPWLTFAIFFLPIYTRLIRARVVENLGELYVVTARAKGASERQIVTGHVARNALGPLAALVAIDIGTLVVAAIYIETIFGLNGIGALVVQNLSGQVPYDRNILVGVVVLVAVAITFANLLADFTLRGLDPRVRLGRASQA